MISIISNSSMPQFTRQSMMITVRLYILIQIRWLSIASNAPLRSALLQVVVSGECKDHLTLRMVGWFQYTVQCGSNQVFDNVLVDTGSAILWVGGADQTYTPGPKTKAYVLHSSTHLNFGWTLKLYSVNLTFCEGCNNGGVKGSIFLDTVVIGNAIASDQFIGAVNTTTGLNLSPRAIDGVRMSLQFPN